MARTPSMTAQEAESILGPRGSIHVDSNNRATVKKWLTTQGFPSMFVGALSMTELALAYNQTDGAGLKRIRDKLNETRETFGTDDDETESKRVLSEVLTGERVPMPQSNGHDSGSAIEQAIRTIAQSVVPAAPSIDAEAVRKIVAEAMTGMAPRILEIRQNGFETIKIEGRRHDKFETLVKSASARMANGLRPNILLVGPTGSGKTHAFYELAKALGLGFESNGAVCMAHELTGFIDAGGTYHDTPCHRAYGAPCLWLQDEIDACDNSAMLCLAGLMANGHYAFPAGVMERHKDSLLCAAANTWGLGATADFVGRNKLDGAINSRFPIRIYWDYDESLEREICGNVDWACRVQKARANARRAGLKVIIDPRMSQAGAGLIANGMTANEAAEITYLANLTVEQRKQVEA